MSQNAPSADLAEAVLEDRHQRRVLTRFTAAVEDGRPCTVLDPSWPDRLRADARSRVHSALREGRVGSGDLIAFSSGSTGVPRGVVRDVASWRASVGALATLTQTSSRDVVWVAGPLWSSLFLYAAYLGTQLGAGLVLQGESPREATVAHVVPSMLPAVRDARAQGRAGRLRRIVVAGDRVAAAEVAACTEVGLDVVEYYGAAELSFVGWRRDTAGPSDGSGGEGVGLAAFPGAQVDLRDGEIWVRSAYLSRGYLLADDTGPMRRDDAGWASVGDRGERCAPGRFVVTGRGDAAVTTGGHTVLVQDVEAHLTSVPGVTDVVVVGVPHRRLGERLVALVTGTATERQLRAAASQLPPPARPGRYLRPQAGLRTSAGKLPRARWQAWARDALGVKDD